MKISNSWQMVPKSANLTNNEKKWICQSEQRRANLSSNSENCETLSITMMSVVKCNLLVSHCHTLAQKLIMSFTVWLQEFILSFTATVQSITSSINQETKLLQTRDSSVSTIPRAPLLCPYLTKRRMNQFLENWVFVIYGGFQVLRTWWNTYLSFKS